MLDRAAYRAKNPTDWNLSSLACRHARAASHCGTCAAPGLPPPAASHFQCAPPSHSTNPSAARTPRELADALPAHYVRTWGAWSAQQRRGDDDDADMYDSGDDDDEMDDT